uniref:Glycoside hydrolase family 5 domain-containing protein n=1 Tax=Alexandrium monilatum TaxID=311494 RepID=A0A7S4UU50_9DINO|mmetsp:Transcript_39916/g.124504  ORF Transcript_39916/g.124504 Transcript_39916/m.124504 type:complete len:592 (+) Transcript_39916:54-1829(+)
MAAVLRGIALTLLACCTAGQRAPRITQDMLPLQVSGRYVVARDGCTRVKLSCINWAGAHLRKVVPAGLHMRTPDYLAGALADIGFNCVRIVYALQMLNATKVDPLWVGNAAASRDAWVNPQLNGLSAIKVLDQVILACTRAGLAVIINNHNSDLGWCCGDNDQNGLWWNDRYPHKVWLAHVRDLTLRFSKPEYKGMVVGFDLRNEIRSSEVAGRWYVARWGRGSQEEDWRQAAMEASEYVLRNSQMLAIVEGIQYAAVLCMLAENPLPAWMANRTLYSAHQYKWTQMGLMVPTMVVNGLSTPVKVWVPSVLVFGVFIIRLKKLRARFCCLATVELRKLRMVGFAFIAVGVVLSLLAVILASLRQCSLMWRFTMVGLEILGCVFLLSGTGCAMWSFVRCCSFRGVQRRRLRIQPEAEEDGLELQRHLQGNLSPEEPWDQTPSSLRDGCCVPRHTETFLFIIVLLPVCLLVSGSFVLYVHSSRWLGQLEMATKWGRFLHSEPPLPVWVGEYGPGYDTDRDAQFHYFIEGDMDLAYWQMGSENGRRQDGTFNWDSYGIFSLDYNATNLQLPDSVMSLIRQTFTPRVTSVECSKT